MGSNCGVLGGVPVAPERSEVSIRGFGLGRGGGCGEGALTGRESRVSISRQILKESCDVPSKLARGVVCSSRLCFLSWELGLRVLRAGLSSGPPLTSREASCSNRDLSELTDERVESSTLSASILVTGEPDNLASTWRAWLHKPRIS